MKICNDRIGYLSGIELGSYQKKKKKKQFIKTGLIWFDFHKQFVYIFFSVIIWSTFLAIAWIHYLSI